MQDETPKDLTERLTLIESMIAEGRRTTQSWGWRFVLWGVAFYVAISWSALGHTPWAWPATMVGAVILTAVLSSTGAGRGVETSMGRAIASVWRATGISMFLLFFALGLTGHLNDARVFVAVISAMLGLTNAATGLILRWKLQVGCAAVWWAAAVGACFVKQGQAMIIFIIAIFISMIGFGVYGMVRDGGEKAHGSPAHV